ncbi:MAG TPA: hypothetical protein VGE26_12230 [Sphingobacteriaceae bacterium]
MRKLFLSAAAILALAVTTTVQAEPLNDVTITTSQDSVSRTPVKLEELPEPVKAALQSEPLKEWTPTAAFLVKEADGREYYQINIKKEEEEGSVKIDKDGKPVK